MKTLWLLGGLGLGTGLMYLLDPERGEERRDVVRGQLAAYGRRTEDLLDDTTRTLGRQAQAVLARTRMPFRHQPELEERLLTPAKLLGIPISLCLLGCVGLGAGLVYLLEPNGGPQRRALLREKAYVYWHKAETLLSSAGHNGVNHTDGRRLEDAHAAHHA
jgi:hypothetical protein